LEDQINKLQGSYRMVDMQNMKAIKERGHSFFSPQVSKKSNASNFFRGETTVTSPGPGIKSIRFENTMSAMSMINQTQGRDTTNNSKMSKIIEGLARKDSELKHLQTDEDFVSGA
tara:strand:+ start:186 stop:530 length:345 start_codon:yes stop_codon:yes gene_type:complete